MSGVKTAVITGGEGDLAKAVCAELERAGGWRVLAPGRAAMDVTSSEAVDAFFAEVESVDLLINNAAITADSLIAQMPADYFDRVLRVCLRGAFLCSRAAIQKMAFRRSGHILNIGSFAALFGTLGQANYAAAKAGLIGLTKSLAMEYGARNLRVNCVLPGFLDTRMTAHLLADEARKKDILGAHLLRRLNTVEDAARFIVFLDSMAQVSGQVFQLDSRVSAWV